MVAALPKSWIKTSESGVTTAGNTLR